MICCLAGVILTVCELSCVYRMYSHYPVSVSVYIEQPAGSRPERTRRIARQFLLMWSCFGTRVIRDMTLQSAPSFGLSTLITHYRFLYRLTRSICSYHGRI